MAWGKAGSTTLTSTGDTITVSGMTASKTIQTLSHVIQTTSNIRMATRVGNGSIDTGSNYVNRSSENGGADSTATSQSYHKNSGSVASDMFAINYAVNVATEEKLFISFNVVRSTAGAGNAPQRMESVGKWVNTSNQFDSIETVNDQAGDYTTDSNLTALGSDITPAAAVPAIENVQDNSLFVEKENARRYWSSGYSPANTATFTDDFSSDNWTDNDSTNIGVSGGALTWSMKRDNTNDASVRDLTSTSDDWVLRFKVTQGSSIGSTGAGNGFFFGISDSDESVAQNSNQDFVGMAYYYDNQSEYNAMDCDGTALPHLYQGDAGQNFNITANDVFYFEIIKNGSSYTVEGFTNSDYSTGSLGQISGTTTATGLRYLKIMNELTNGSIPTSTNPFNGTIDDLKFYDGVTNVDAVPATWTMQPTFKDDFSSDKGWLSQDSGNSVTGGSLVFKGVVDNTNDAISYDLGTALSDTNWICRFKLNFTTLTSGSGYKTYFGISSASSATAQNGTHDFIGMSVRKQNNTLGSHDVDGGAIPDGAENTGGLTYATGTDYYFEIIRLSSTTYEIRRYSDSTYSTISQTVTGTCASTVTGLQYFGIWNHIVSAGDVHAGTLDDLKIYDGVTSIN